MSSSSDFLIIGAGIFGVTTALELRGRGYDVTLIDPGPLPYPLAASTDVSKVVRMEYGKDRQYMRMVMQAIEGFQQWNEEFGEDLYHETGVLMVSKEPMSAGGYVDDSFRMLLQEGHWPEKLSADEITRRFPAWNPSEYAEGFYHARGGYAESERVVSKLVAQAKRANVAVYAGQTADELLLHGSRVRGVHTQEGQTFLAEHTVVAAGAWTPWLLPELQQVMQATGHPIFHLRPSDSALFTPPNFVVFTADTARTGWYGFPLLRGGIVKVGNHGVGLPLHPEHDERAVYEEDCAQLRGFLASTFPALLEADIVYTRRCLYNDTLDEHFWIDRHPGKEGLSVAAGGSGHGFKFAPVLGGLIADVVENKTNDWAQKFRWRNLAADTQGQEASRFHGNTA